jgi:Mg2+-importing ATPase
MKFGLFFKEYYNIQPPDVFRAPVGDLKTKEEIFDNLKKYTNFTTEQLFEKFSSSVEGLPYKEAKKRLEKEFGKNEITEEERKPFIVRFLLTFNNPLTLLLLFLILVSLITGDLRTSIVIFSMVLISVLVKFVQEEQAFNAVQNLRSLVKTTSTVIRNGRPTEISLAKVVPGDIIRLSAGDIVPADLRLIQSKDLFINQSLLTGEALPVEKHAATISDVKVENLLESQNLCFTGTNVQTGAAVGIVIETGDNTYFGNLAKSISGQRTITSFDKGIDKFTWLMMRFMLVMTPLVFVINGLGKGNWWEAFLFAISIAVGLTPEMLPAIVAVNLSKGAVDLSKKKVIVKRLNSVQNLGAINVLCTDKTGTLTKNTITLIKHVNIQNKNDDKVYKHAYLNSSNETGFKNLLDTAVLKYGQSKNIAVSLIREYTKVDELPFDFQRKRLSIILQKSNGEKIMTTKGAVEEVLSVCNSYELDNKTHKLTGNDMEKIKKLDKDYAKEGFRVIAVAYRTLVDERRHYQLSDEKDLIFLGLMTFLDPPKESTRPVIKKLQESGVLIKVLTGDNEFVTKKICSEVGLETKNILLGSQIEKMSDVKLQDEVMKTTIFAKLSPDNKKRIVAALQQKDNVVGYLGDGINDAPALRAADVGISVDGAVDIAKESADIILLETSLLVLSEGVFGGRKVFGNIIKYIRMGASSNFGNMFSVLGASLFLPFLPMSAIQILTNNLLYDISQFGIPTDNVDEEYLVKPRKWNMEDIKRFMIFIGPISSIFDYSTFFVMLFIFGAWKNPHLFQTGWFVESLLTQTLIVHVIRSRKIPFLQTMASLPMLITTFSIMIVGALLTFSPLATTLGFVKLPYLYWPILLLILISYVSLTQFVKTWFSNKFGYY